MNAIHYRESVSSALENLAALLNLPCVATWITTANDPTLRELLSKVASRIVESRASIPVDGLGSVAACIGVGGAPMTKRLLYMLERLHEKTQRAEQIHSERGYPASLHAREESDRELASILDAVKSPARRSDR